MKITVTQEHIDQGRENLKTHNWIPSSCPVAMAVKARFPNAEYVSVGLRILAIDNTNFYISPTARKAISKFDDTKQMEPFSFIARKM